MRELNRKEGQMVSGGTGGAAGPCPTGDGSTQVGTGSNTITVCGPPGSTTTTSQGKSGTTVTLTVPGKKTSSKSGGGFWNDLCTGTLTTAGGLVGGAAGSFADPIVGPLGTITGGLIGDAAGQSAAQKICNFSVG